MAAASAGKRDSITASSFACPSSTKFTMRSNEERLLGLSSGPNSDEDEEILSDEAEGWDVPDDSSNDGDDGASGKDDESDDEGCVDLSELLNDMSSNKKTGAIVPKAGPSSSSAAGSVTTAVSKKRRRIPERTEAYEEGEFQLPARPSDQVDISTLVAAFAEDQEFGRIKRQVVRLNRDNEESKRETAPLPERMRSRLERQVAYDSARSDADKWKCIVEKHKELPTLQFPLQTEKVSRTTAALATEYHGASTLDQSIADVVEKEGLGTGAIEVETPTELPYNPADPEEVRRRRDELRCMRELAFRHEIKQKRHAKIKSKSYRKLLKKERERTKEEELRHLLETDPDAAREHVAKMELERAKGRLTLKNKSRSKWAQFMLEQGGEGGLATREEIVEQLQEEEALQARIRGITSKHVSALEAGEDAENDAEEGQGDEATEADAIVAQGGAEDAPTKGLFGMKFMVRAQEQRAKALAEAEEEEDEGMETRMPGRRVIGATNKTPSTSVSITPHDDDVAERKGRSNGLEPSGSTEVTLRMDMPDGFEDHEDLSGNGSGKKISFQAQKDMIALAFAGDDVVREFVEEKERLAESEAPQEIDLTLPGWGSWSGGKLEPKRRVIVKRTGGVAKTDRKDAQSRHVIISERRQNALMKYVATSVPHPYHTKEQYEAAMRQTVGKEWVTSSSFQSLTVPRVKVKAGAVLQPLRFIQQEADHWAERKTKARDEQMKARKEARKARSNPTTVG